MSCTCEKLIINTGAGCAPKIEIGSKLIFVDTFKADGSRNFIDATTTLDSAFWTSQVNAVIDQRWLPSLQLDLVTDVAGDAIVQDLGAGVTKKVADGVDIFTGSMVGKLATNILYGSFKSLECSDHLSAYIVTADGSLQGVEYNNDKTKFYPIRIQDGSFSVKFMKGNINTPNCQQIDITFNWARIESVEDIRVILESEMTDPVNDVTGLKSVNGAMTLPTTTSITFTLTSDFGSGITNSPITGLIATDLTLAEISPTPGAIPVLTLVETGSTGVYIATFAAETIGDVVQPTFTKDGFEFTPINSQTTTLA